MSSKSITKNVVFLTFMNILMQTLSLIVNVCITRHLGSATIGSVSLLGTFYGLLCVISSANVYVCTSRLGAAEEGKGGNCDTILKYSLVFSLSITFLTCIFVKLMSNMLLPKLSLPLDSMAIMLLLCGLPLASVGSALKGYFNSKRLQYIPAFADITEFLIKSGTLMFFVEFFVITGKYDIYSSIAISTICGESASLILMLVLKKIKCKKSVARASMKFSKFAAISIPIMLNSYVCAFLSSANDFLMPFTLRQSGSNMSDALSKFGIFEAIVLPVLFFPSCVIISLSTIILPEVSRALGENNYEKIKKLASSALKLTLMFSIFVASILFIKGDFIADAICGEPLAGKTLKLLSPIVPFIYLEIILEAIIKGMGRHGFSSINYLAEYVIRISILLVCVPLFGFAGVIVSYAASNICSNVARLFMLSKTADAVIKPFEYIILPLALSSLCVGFAHLIGVKSGVPTSIFGVFLFCLIALLPYMALYVFVSKVTLNFNKKAQCDI